MSNIGYFKGGILHMQNYEIREVGSMDSDIESLDQKRMAFLKWYLIGFAVSMLLLLARHFFRLDGLNSQPIGNIVLVGLVVALLEQVICVVGSALIERDIHRDPRLDAALNNELVKALVTQSWIAAFVGSSGMTLFFAITSSFYPICDALTICLSSIVMGIGASRAYFYFRYRAL
jgi:hypothetical protein